SCPGRGAALFALLRRAGTHSDLDRWTRPGMTTTSIESSIAQRMLSSEMVSSATLATCLLSPVSRVAFQPPCANQHAETIATAIVVTGNDHHRPDACRLVCLERT